MSDYEGLQDSPPPPADPRDRLDRALSESERFQRIAHLCNGRSQRLVGLLERAIAELVRAGQGDVAAELGDALRVALKERP